MSTRPDPPRRLVAEAPSARWPPAPERSSHLNPAVALAFAAARHFPPREVGPHVALEALMMGSVTGASMNPARSLAPALAASEWGDLWIYLIGPTAGALAGAALYAFMRAAPGAAPALIEQEEIA